jgi:hypothetical protein
MRVRRPVTALLLMVFMALELYLAHGRVDIATAGGMRRLLPEPTGVAQVSGRTYLVGERQVWQLTGTDGASITPIPTRWVDVPQPSGQGIWRVLLGADHVPLVGLGGPVYTSPTGRTTLWIDPGTRSLYRSHGVGALHAAASLTGVMAVRWKPGGAAALVYGQGPEGTGIYEVKDSQNPRLMLATGGTPVMSFGITRGGAVLAALSTGQVVEAGASAPILTAKPVWVGQNGTVLGFLPHDRAVLASPGHSLSLTVPAVPVSAPRFVPGGTPVAAYIAQVGRTPELVVVTRAGITTTKIPGTPAEVTGFMNHDVIVAVIGGAHAGTYAISALHMNATR